MSAEFFLSSAELSAEISAQFFVIAFHPGCHTFFERFFSVGRIFGPNFFRSDLDNWAANWAADLENWADNWAADLENWADDWAADLVTGLAAGLVAGLATNLAGRLGEHIR